MARVGHPKRVLTKIIILSIDFYQEKLRFVLHK